ncbi:MAG: hypothetical protein RLZZ344_1754 [Pseudomonadota bacterium]
MTPPPSRPSLSQAKTSLGSHVSRTFLAGLLAIFPFVATALLLVFAGRLVIEWFGPNSRFGQVLTQMGLGLSGSEWVGYTLGLMLVGLFIFGLGLIVERGLQKWVHGLIDGLMGRIPVVRTVYETIRQFVQLISHRDESRLNSMQPVWCQFGGEGGVTVLALLSSSEPVYVKDRLCYAVVVPTAPVPIGGGLLFVPTEWVTNAEIGMEALTSIYVSLGVTAPQALRSQRGSAASAPAETEESAKSPDSERSDSSASGAG